MDIAGVFIDVFPLLLRGIGVTVQTTVIALVIAIFLGLVVCFANISRIKIFTYLARFYIWAIRGTPLMVQVFFVYFGIPQLFQSMGFDFRLTPLSAGIITLSLNAGAYIAEIYRGGIMSVEAGQMEAARSLGLSHYHAMFKIVLPQAIRVSAPSLVNQFIISLKDTSIISVISLADIVYQAKIYIGRTMQSFATWTIVGVFYLVIITILSSLSRRVEKRLNHGRKSMR
jgi:His/Glu/Gln/Arg/opine family amino acid ABC transporter permease subunit